MSLPTANDFMPKDELAQKILKDRAQEFAVVHYVAEAIGEKVDYIKFRLGNRELYGIPYQYASEVLHNVVPTQMSYVPNFISGIINYRGILIAVVDLKKFFHIHSDNEQSNSYIIVVSNNKTTLGMQVDSIVGSDSFELNSLASPLPSQDISEQDYICGIHLGNIAILNIKSILDSPMLEMQKYSK